MAMTARWLLGVIGPIYAPFAGWAQPSGSEAPAIQTSVSDETRAGETQLQPPVLLTGQKINPPPEVAELEGPVTVVVSIRVSATGEVEGVQLVHSAGAPFDRAVMVAATHFEFKPATVAGKPVDVEIEFSQTFLPPETTDHEGPATDARLTGTVVEKGTRKPLGGVRLVATVADKVLETTTDAEGKFDIALPHGDIVVEIYSYEHKGFRAREALAAEEHLEVRYLVERLSYSPYEAVVIAKRERHVVARTTLRGREIKQVPGTFGDPFRVISTLPGVASIMSLIAYPIVRGTSPGNTGFLLDGVRVPQLFHLLAGPAVVHPEFIDRVDFYPGSFPAEYGGYTGGIVDGIVRRARTQERTFDAHLDLTKAGLFFRGPVKSLGLTGTVAGRYGYPGLLLDLLNTEVYASYWDYQVQLDGGNPRHSWGAFIFGSYDEMGEVSYEGERLRTAGAQFHRIDLYYRVGLGALADTYKLVLGLDRTLADQDAEKLMTLSAEPRARWNLGLRDDLLVQAGIDLVGRRFSGKFLIDEEVNLELESHMLGASGFAALVWHPSERLILIPGIRTDVYHNREATQIGVDPRLLCRYRLHTGKTGDVWLKGGLGIYHQPPRFLVPVPGFEEMALRYGLLASTQVSLGVEAPVFADLSLDTQLYFNWMDPILFDLSYDLASEDEEVSADELFRKRTGRSYGIEVLLKHHGRSALFGWLSYTLSWSERREGGRWVPFDFDQRHMLNMVAGISLARNWDVAARISFQSRRPAPSGGLVPPFYRVDIRIDKRAVWNEWLLDFYVDIINTTLSAETVDSGSNNRLRYTLPTVGFRAVF